MRLARSTVGASLLLQTVLQSNLSIVDAKRRPFISRGRKRSYTTHMQSLSQTQSRSSVPSSQSFETCLVQMDVVLQRRGGAQNNSTKSGDGGDNGSGSGKGEESVDVKRQVLESYVEEVGALDQAAALQHLVHDDDDDNENGKDKNTNENTKSVSDKDKQNNHANTNSKSLAAKEEDEAIIGLKQHHRQSLSNRKKGNAVGDPDGNSDDDSEDSNSESEEEIAELMAQAAEKMRSAAQRLVDGITDIDGDDIEDGIEEDDEEARVDVVAHHPFDNDDDDEEEEHEDGSSSDDIEHPLQNVELKVDMEIVSNPVDTDVKVVKRTRGGATTTMAAANDISSHSNSDAPTLYDDETNQHDHDDNDDPILKYGSREWKEALDDALLRAFLPMLYLPPPLTALDHMRQSATALDVSSRRRLDRRTLYQSLVLELTLDSSKSTVSSTLTSKSTGHRSKRRFLDPIATRNLRSALSLASQPRWRKHVVLSPSHLLKSDNDNDTIPSSSNNEMDQNTPWWWRGGVRLYSTPEEEFQDSASSSPQSQPQQLQTQHAMMNGMWGSSSSSSSSNNNPNEDDEGREEREEQQRTEQPDIEPSLAMQETVAMALAHSLNCGLALVDDAAFRSVKRTLVNDKRLGLRADSKELRPACLVDHLIRLADEGKFGVAVHGGGLDGDDGSGVGSGRVYGGGRISDRMERDLALGLDDPYDELAVESLMLLKQEEELWYGDNNDTSDTSDTSDTNTNSNDDSITEQTNPPLPLVLFLRTDTSQSLLKSKSTVERLARECLGDSSIHLLVLGKGIDATTVSLPNRPDSTLPQHRTNRHPFGTTHTHSNANHANTPFFPNQPRPNDPFSGMSMNPPPSMGFSQQNINASGVNDPEGSRRFNIFLARTVDADGTPGIVGAIAPPQAGNLFPQMMARQAMENANAAAADPNNRHSANLKRWAELVEQQSRANGNAGNHGGGANGNGMPLPPPQFFNASIGSNPFGGTGGNGGPNESGNNNEQHPMSNAGMIPPPPELIQKAIESAVSDVMDRLTEMSSERDGNGNEKDEEDDEALPPHLARAFAQILSNDNLRRGIAENLARAAPALVDPRCQGVMLSVYVPPGPDHPNRGMMPGQQQRRGKGQSFPTQGGSTRQGKGGSNGGPGMGGWLNKILSSSSSNANEEGAPDEDAVDDAEADSENEEEEEEEGEGDESGESDSVAAMDSSEPEESSSESPAKSSARRRSKREKRARLAAVAAAMAATQPKKSRKSSDDSSGSGVDNAKSFSLTSEQKAQKNLVRLQALCRNIPLETPSDPVRSRSWQGWASRERGAVIFRKNRKVLNDELSHRSLRLTTNTGTNGLGSILRQMMSVKDVSSEMDEVIKCAVEIEAARSQRLKESPWESSKKMSGSTDESLKQLLSNDGGSTDFNGHFDEEIISLVDQPSTSKSTKVKNQSKVQYIHPKSIESALSIICRISPSPSGASTSNTSTAQVTHRTKDEIAALAQDKHERALVSQVVSPQDIGVSYDMIGGLSDVKELLRQSITYPLKFPHLYSEGIAREAVKGVLLFGPPGTGKTMLAKAVATEGGATFLSVDASSVENKWLGESEKNAKAVFTLARRLAPCVIFIDEVDSILSSREGSSDDSAHGTLTSVKTTMMSEWDGLNSGTNGKGEAGSDRVVVIGSTNRPFDLDEAVLRRFPRRILVDLPDMDTRREILEVTLAENRIDPSVNLTVIAERLEGYTGSDIKEVCREAVVQISHEQARLLDLGLDVDVGEDDVILSSAGVGKVTGLQRLRPVTMKDFESAMDKLKRSVSEKGRELARVWEWNDEYGEIKKKDQRGQMPQLMNMFL